MTIKHHLQHLTSRAQPEALAPQPAHGRFDTAAVARGTLSSTNQLGLLHALLLRALAAC
jgi:hypothetical protein